MNSCGRFRFSLETLLKVRGLREEQARLELARALVRLELSRRALADSERLLAEKVDTLQSLMAQEVAVEDYQMHTRYLEHLQGALQGWRARISREEAEIEEQKRRVQRLYQERRLLSNLKEKYYLRFKRELAKRLEKEAEAGVICRWSGTAPFQVRLK